MTLSPPQLRLRHSGSGRTAESCATLVGHLTGKLVGGCDELRRRNHLIIAGLVLDLRCCTKLGNGFSAARGLQPGDLHATPRSRPARAQAPAGQSSRNSNSSTIAAHATLALVALLNNRLAAGRRPDKTFSDATGRKGSTRPPRHRESAAGGWSAEASGRVSKRRSWPTPTRGTTWPLLGPPSPAVRVRRGLKLLRRAGHYLPSGHDLPGGHDLAEWGQVGRGRGVTFTRGQELSWRAKSFPKCGAPALRLGRPSREYLPGGQEVTFSACSSGLPPRHTSPVHVWPESARPLPSAFGAEGGKCRLVWGSGRAKRHWTGT